MVQITPAVILISIYHGNLKIEYTKLETSSMKV